jgi:opacity protein-like surface antigen
MSKTCTALAAGFLLVLTPAAAHADWLLSPMLGQTFGGDTHGRVHTVFGAAIGQLDEEAFGWEADFAYSPDFFEGADGDFDFTGNNSRVVTAMLNVLASGSTTAIRPYVTVGLGLMQIDVESNDGLFESTTRELGYNAGVGLMGLIGDRLGLRADLRYMRSFQNQLPSWTRGIDIDVAPGNFDYFRAGVGLTVRLGQ